MHTFLVPVEQELQHLKPSKFLNGMSVSCLEYCGHPPGLCNLNICLTLVSLIDMMVRFLIGRNRPHPCGVNRFPFSSALLYRESCTLLSLVRKVYYCLFALECALKLTNWDFSAPGFGSDFLHWEIEYKRALNLLKNTFLFLLQQ